jgi:glycosyltransferase involved in cell wall biosynthesis
MNSVPARVSIGMAVYNEGEFLRLALSSLLAQDFTDFELIISDSASTDATQRICLEYAAADGRVRYCRNQVNLGPIENFNRVFRLSSGKYFMWASGHDLWAPTFISRCVELLERDPSVVLCYPDAQLMDTAGKLLGVARSNLDTRNCTLLGRFNLTIWDRGHGFKVYGMTRSDSLWRTRLMQRVWTPDQVLLSELAILGSFVNIPEPLFYARDKWGEVAGANKNKWTKAYFDRTFPGKQNRWLWLFPHASVAYGEALGVMHARLRFMTKASLITFVLLGWLYKSLPFGMRHPLQGVLRRLLHVIWAPLRNGQAG